MAKGALFNNTGRKHHTWQAWGGSLEFLREDIDYLVKLFNEGRTKVSQYGEEAVVYLNAEVKTKDGKEYLQLKMGKCKPEYDKPTKQDSSPAAPAPKAPPVEEPSDTILTLDDL